MLIKNWLYVHALLKRRTDREAALELEVGIDVSVLYQYTLFLIPDAHRRQYLSDQSKNVVCSSRRVENLVSHMIAVRVGLVSLWIMVVLPA